MLMRKIFEKKMGWDLVGRDMVLRGGISEKKLSRRGPATIEISAANISLTEFHVEFGFGHSEFLIGHNSLLMSRCDD